jgi:sugar lactone lactonase YvrE
MNSKRLVVIVVLSCLMLLGATPTYAWLWSPPEPDVSLLVSGLEGASGSAIGPDGALYVAEGAAGRISRIELSTGEVTTFASGLPLAIFPVGGVSDVAFIDGTAYALVTIVGSDVGGSDVVGIYRVDGASSFTVIADLGAYALANPPTIPFDYFIPTGVHYAMEPYRGGLLVTDAHLNRVLWVGLDGEITELLAFGNVVPTGLEVQGRLVLMAEAGPVPHLPQDGKVLAFGFKLPTVEVASGVRLPVDVAFGPGHVLYVLSQGFHAGGPDGSPAEPNTGAVVRLTEDGTFSEVVGHLNQPTSFEFVGNTAYIVTLTGEILKVKGVMSPPSGLPH